MNRLLKKTLLRIPAVRPIAVAVRSQFWALQTSIERRRGVSANPIKSVKPAPSPIEKKTFELLVEAIESGSDFRSPVISTLCRDVEAAIARQAIDPIQATRDIGKAIFDRGPAHYTSTDLPAYLKRFTYPAYLSVHLNEHCNAACFFCRDADFDKGRLLDFDQLHKIDSGIKMARVVELTGWGEPFFYPKLEQAVDKCLSLNDSPHLLSFTTNGSMLSSAWGKRLAGKIHRLCISINAATAPTYATQMRYKNKRFTFDYVINHIREFMAELTPDDISRMAFHMVANTDNFREIPTLVRLAAEMRIPTVTIGNYLCADDRYMDKTLIGVKREYNDVLDKATSLSNRLNVALHARRFFVKEETVRAQDTCMAPFERLYAEVPGDVAPCCFMGRHRMGNIYEAGVEAVWFSEEMQALRKNRFLPACTTCTLYNPFDDEISHLSPYMIGDKKLGINAT